MWPLSTVFLDSMACGRRGEDISGSEAPSGTLAQNALGGRGYKARSGSCCGHWKTQSCHSLPCLTRAADVPPRSSTWL
ncbi:mCG19209, isoform CRA_b [Mus musculus]|nr:mCG19209, isoform CRA_b [Mus musculus]